MLKFEEKLEQGFQPAQNAKGLKRIRKWFNGVNQLDLMMKVQKQLLCKVYDDWIKFKISITRCLNSHEEKISQYLQRVRRQMRWVVQVMSHKTPEPDLITSKLYKQCEQLMNEKHKVNMQTLLSKCRVIRQKIHDSAKKFVESSGNVIQSLTKDFKRIVSMKNILNQSTYFYFHEDLHHRKIILQSPERVTVDNKSYDMDFGAVVCPYFSKANNKIKFRIDGNNHYQSFIGLGICHPKLMKKCIYRTSGPDSGCYILRQQSNCENLLILNHAYEKQGNKSNMKTLKWGFTVGDIIEIEIDYERSKAIFRKNQNTYAMKLDLDGVEIAAYVALHTDPDTVTIVNE